MNVRYRVPIRDGVAIEGAIVPTWPPISRCLPRYHAERRGPGARGRANNPKLEHVLEFPFGSFETVRCETSGTSGGGRPSGLNVMCDLTGVSGVVTFMTAGNSDAIRVWDIVRAEIGAWRGTCREEYLYLKVCVGVN